MIGRVVSTKSLKTVTVLVSRVAKHALYKKTYVQSKKYLVDDQKGVKIGDIVEFIKCKPISKRKNWTITKVLGKTFTEIAEAELKKRADETIAVVMPPSSAEASEGKEKELEKVEMKEVKKKNVKVKKEKNGST